MTDMSPFFPEMITRYPGADIPLDGVTSRLIQAGQQQFIFMEFDCDVEVPAHSHNAQWGVVLEGQIELNIDGQTRIFTKGDSYFVDRMHSAKIKKGYKDLTLFDQADRYKVL
jgi:quercetin dioxygenase-like cupin family protein